MRKRAFQMAAVAVTVAVTGAVGSTATPTASAASASGNIADHTLAGVPTMIIRPGTWSHTNDTLMRQDTDAAVADGLAAKGWDIVAVDDDWMIKDNGQDWDAPRSSRRAGTAVTRTGT